MNWREYSCFFGLAARLTRGVDGYQQLGQPDRWSRGRSDDFPWHLDAVLLLFPPERMTIWRLTLARVVAAAGSYPISRKISWNNSFGTAISTIWKMPWRRSGEVALGKVG
jgi:hypothetical protein